jgi:hypothetical protein
MASGSHTRSSAEPNFPGVSAVAAHYLSSILTRRGSRRTPRPHTVALCAQARLTAQGALAPYWQWVLLPSVAATITGLLATGAGDVGKEEVYVAYETAAGHPDNVGVAVLHTVRGASLANARALSVRIV